MYITKKKFAALFISSIFATLMMLTINLGVAHADDNRDPNVPLNLGINKQVLYSFQSSSKPIIEKVGPLKSNYHDKQALGIIIPQNTSLKVRQTNIQFATDLQIEFLNNDAKLEKSFTIPMDGSWVTLTNDSALSAPFIVTPYASNLEIPAIEYEITSTMEKLPYYTYKGNQAAFFQLWDTNDSEFAVTVADRVQMLIPKKDKEGLRNLKDFQSIDQQMEHYDAMVKLYDKLAGVSEDNPNPIHKTQTTKYFVKANVHGAGSAYYSGSHTAANSDTMGWFYFDKGWGSNHEFGHGYDSIPGTADMPLGEVWNNIYSYTFERTYLAEELGWLNKGSIEKKIFDERTLSNKAYAQFDLSERLYFFVTMFDAIGIDKLTYFNQNFREKRMSEGGLGRFTSADMLALYLSESSQKNVAPHFESYKIEVSSLIKERLRMYDGLVSLKEVVKTESKATDIKNLYGLPSIYSLVSTDQLKNQNIFGAVEIELQIDDKNQIMNKEVVIKNGQTEVARVAYKGDKLSIPNLPVGVYTLYLPYGNTNGYYNIDNQTIYVKEDETTKKVVNYQKITTKGISDSQTIQLLGLGDGMFGTVNVNQAEKKATITVNGQPHSYFTTAYSKVEILNPEGSVIYSKDFIGNENYAVKETVDIDTNYKIKVYHAEPTRLQVFDEQLLMKLPIVNTTDKTNEFIVTEYGLKNVTNSEDLSKNVLERIESYATIIRGNLSSDEIKDDVHFKTYRNQLFAAIQNLPADQRPALMEKYADILVDDWYQTTFQLLGLSSWNFANVVINPATKKATVTVNTGRPHAYFSNTYAKISILNTTGKEVYTKDLIGNVTYDFSNETIPFEEGYTVKIYHAESDIRLKASDVTGEIPITKTQNMSALTMINGKLVDTTNQTTISLHGLSSWNFANVMINPATKKAYVTVNTGRPHAYFADTYAKISVLDATGKGVYTKDLIGNATYNFSIEETPFEEGYTVKIYHAESDIRLKASDITGEIPITKIQNFSALTMINGKLVDTTNQTTINLHGLSSWNFANVMINPAAKQAFVTVNSGRPHAYFSDTYAKISVLDATGKEVYTKDLIGNVTYNFSNEATPFEEGYTVKIYHAESDIRLKASDVTGEIPITKTQNFSALTMINGKLVDTTNQTTISLHGLSSRNFANVMINPVAKQVFVTVNSGRPHAYFSNTYAKISVLDAAGKEVYTKDLIGDVTYNFSDEATPFEEGFTVKIYHAESDTRLKASDVTGEIPITKTQNAIALTLTNGKLVEATNQTTVNLYGLGDWNFAKVVVDPATKKALVTVNSGQPHSYISKTYAIISVLDAAGKEVYTKDLIGNIDSGQSKDSVAIDEGYKIKIYHAESANRLSANNSLGDFPLTKTDNFSVLKLENGNLIDVSNSAEAVTSSKNK